MHTRHKAGTSSGLKCRSKFDLYQGLKKVNKYQNIPLFVTVRPSAQTSKDGTFMRSCNRLIHYFDHFNFENGSTKAFYFGILYRCLFSVYIFLSYVQTYIQMYDLPPEGSTKSLCVRDIALVSTK